MKYTYLYITLALLAACSGAETVPETVAEPQPQAATAAIGFKTIAIETDGGDADTRASDNTRAGNETTTATLSTINVSAWTTPSPYTTYFSQVPFVKNTVWESATPYYWPVSGGLEFLAYYPSTLINAGGHVTNYNALTGPGQDANTGTIGYQYDPVVAFATGNIKQYNFGRTPVPLTFKHALAAVEVMIQNTNTAYLIDFADIAIVGANTLCTYGIVIRASQTIGWVTTTPGCYKYYTKNSSAATNGYRTITNFTSSYYAFYNGTPLAAYVLPQAIQPATKTELTNVTSTLSGLASKHAYLAVLVRIRTSAGAYEYPYDANVAPTSLSGYSYKGFGWVAFPLPAITWQQGKKYCYRINFGKDISAQADNLGVVPAWPATGDTHFPAGAKVLGTEIQATVSVTDWDMDDEREILLNTYNY